MTLAERYVDQLAPFAIEDRDEPSILFVAYCTALGAPAEEIAALCLLGPPGWTLWDPLQCPAWHLAACAVMYGVRVDPMLPEAQNRLRIASLAGWTRGRDVALTDAVRPTLTGAVPVMVFQRRYDPENPGVDSPGHTTFFTRTQETPDPALTLAALELAKVTGHVMHLLVIAGQTYAEAQFARPTLTYAQAQADSALNTITYAQAQAWELEL